ncbi:MAG TPA: TonB-dependent receptor, partial [Caulobacterales bacterium]|nr:TonB-dependent receptor [Caulobacterales bacterium]
MFKTTVSRIALLACLTALPATTAAAADGDQDRFALGEVVIAGRALDGTRLGGAEVDAEDLRKFDKTALDQALDLVPGANSGNTGGSRNERVIYIRGFDRLQTTISIDGVRVYLPADNRLDYGRFLTADLSEVQVSKGYVSVLDGPGGVGGAVNLVTRKPAAPFEAEATASATFDGDGTYNGYGVSGRIGGRWDKFYVQGSGARTERDHFALSDDFTPTPAEDGGDRDKSDTEDYSFNLKAGFTPNATDEYALSYIKQSGAKNAPIHVTDPANSRFWKWPYWDIDSLYFLSDTRLGDRSRLKTRIYRNTFRNLLAAYDDVTQTTQTLPRAFNSYYDDTAYGAVVRYDIDLDKVNTLRGAFHYRRDEHNERQDGFVRVNGPPTTNAPFSEPWQKTEEDTFSLALEDTQKVSDKIDLVVGVSYDWTDLKQADEISVFASGSTVNLVPVSFPLNGMDAMGAQGALTYRFESGARLYASISSRTRFPTLMERFSTRFGTAVPNPGIGPERATNYEIGGSTRIGANAKLEGAVFDSELTDALVSVPVTLPAPIGAVTQNQNVASARYYGVEGSIEARLSDRVTLGGNYTHIERDYDDPTNPGLKPIGVPRDKALVYVDWRPVHGLTVTPSIEAASDRWTVTSSSTISPALFYRTGRYTL